MSDEQPLVIDNRCDPRAPPPTPRCETASGAPMLRKSSSHASFMRASSSAASSASTTPHFSPTATPVKSSPISHSDARGRGYNNYRTDSGRASIVPREAEALQSSPDSLVPEPPAKRPPDGASGRRAQQEGSDNLPTATTRLPLEDIVDQMLAAWRIKSVHKTIPIVLGSSHGLGLILWARLMCALNRTRMESALGHFQQQPQPSPTTTAQFAGSETYATSPTLTTFTRLTQTWQDSVAVHCRVVTDKTTSGHGHTDSCEFLLKNWLIWEDDDASSVTSSSTNSSVTSWQLLDQDTAVCFGREGLLTARAAGTSSSSPSSSSDVPKDDGGCGVPGTMTPRQTPRQTAAACFGREGLLTERAAGTSSSSPSSSSDVASDDGGCGVPGTMIQFTPRDACPVVAETAPLHFPAARRQFWPSSDVDPRDLVFLSPRNLTNAEIAEFLLDQTSSKSPTGDFWEPLVLSFEKVMSETALWASRPWTLSQPSTLYARGHLDALTPRISKE